MQHTSILQFTTIAEFLFTSTPEINFPQLVTALGRVSNRIGRQDREISWTDDETVTFDMPGTRISLSLHDEPRSNVRASLCLSVGPSHLACANQPVHRLLSPARHAALCSRLAERVLARVNASGIIWHETPFAVKPIFLERLSEMADPEVVQTDARINPFPKVEDDLLKAILSRSLSDRHNVAQPHISLHRQSYAPLPPPRESRDPELARLRRALYPQDLITNLTDPQSPMLHLVGGLPVMTWKENAAASAR